MPIIEAKEEVAMDGEVEDETVSVAAAAVSPAVAVVASLVVVGGLVVGSPAGMTVGVVVAFNADQEAVEVGVVTPLAGSRNKLWSFRC